MTTITVEALFTKNVSDPATGLALSDIALYLTAQNKTTLDETIIWDGSQHPTDEATNIGAYARLYADADLATYDYLASAHYTGSTVLDADWVVGTLAEENVVRRTAPFPAVQLRHTCSIIQAGTTTSYSTSVASWTSGTTTTSLIPCLIQPQTKRELATGAVIGTHRLFIEVADVPASFLVMGAEKTHRVATWAHDGLTDAGPFDVVEIVDAAGQGHHVEVLLKRTAS